MVHQIIFFLIRLDICGFGRVSTIIALQQKVISQPLIKVLTSSSAVLDNYVLIIVRSRSKFILEQPSKVDGFWSIFKIVVVKSLRIASFSI